MTGVGQAGTVGDKARVRGAGPALVVLVRPDGYVAARGTPRRLTQATGYLHGVLGESAARPAPAGITPG